MSRASARLVFASFVPCLVGAAALFMSACKASAEKKSDTPETIGPEHQKPSSSAQQPAQSAPSAHAVPPLPAESTGSAPPSSPQAPSTTCSTIAPLSPYRYSPSLTRLSDGRVLIAGGRQSDDSEFLADVNLYDPKTKSLKPGPKMREARAMHGAALAGDGRVVVASGRVSKYIEVFDPKTNQWSKVGAFANEVVHPVVATLPGGNVLIAGGDLMWKGALSDEAFVFQFKTSKLQKIAAVPEPRAGEFAVTLSDGSIALSGDRSRGMEPGPVQALIFDEKTGWKQAPILDARLKALESAGHEFGLVEQVPNGRPALLLGYKSIYLFDNARGKWQSIADFEREQIGASAVMIDDTTVLVAGGLDEERSVLTLCSIRW